VGHAAQMWRQSDVKDADVVFIRAIERRESPLDRALVGQ
jgi:hypothetical protein